jgi:valyl-tRNA synthetase
VLVTGFDILFFWVARMIMMGLKFMNDVPFRDVYIHALVRDQEGQKMSKSKGNVIDPLEIMSRYGTDAFRFTLAAMAAMGRDVKLAEERISGYQNFVNKLWNAARFVMMNLAEEAQIKRQDSTDDLETLGEEGLNLADRWILSRLASTIDEARKAIDGYRFNELAHHLYQFTWHEFCDWYLEMSKLSLNGSFGDDPVKTQRVLAGVLEKILFLLHPVMPFVTEEIWQAFTGQEEKRSARSLLEERKWSIMVQDYPRPRPEWLHPEAESKIGLLTDVTRAIRNLRSEMNLPPSREVKVILFGAQPSLAILQTQEPYLRSLARVGSLEYLTEGERPKVSATAVVGGVEVYLPLAGAVNLEEEKKRLKKEISEVEADLDRVRNKLANQSFLAKARKEIVEKDRDKATRLEEKRRTLTQSLERIQGN